MPSALQFLHGVETQQVLSATQPVAINKWAVLGLIGTAPLADAAIYPLNEPVLLASEPQKAAKLGVTGTLLASLTDFWAEGGGAAIVVRVAEGADAAATMTNIIGSAVAKTGVQAFLTARAKTGVTPRTLIAPGFTSGRPGGASNPVVAALLPIAKRLRGRIYASTPSTSIANAIQWRADWTSDRVLPIYPNIKAWDAATSAYVTRPGDAAFAGLTARVHRDNGFWFSPSNFAFNAVGGISTPVDWQSGDPDSEANTLNENRICTLINMGASAGVPYGGWRRWGNRTTADDANWVFECVRTALDAVYEALEEVTLWAVDKPPSKDLLEQMMFRANEFMRFGVREGFLVGGRFWIDPEDNPPGQLANGVWNWRMDPEAPAPMEHIVHNAQRNNTYYARLVSSLKISIDLNA
jgi:hypothetical protein